MKKLEYCKILFFVFLSISQLSFSQNNYTINSLEALQSFTSISTKEIVGDLAIVEPIGSTAFPEAEIMKVVDRVEKITGTLTLDGLSLLTTTVGIIDRIDCSEAGFVFRNCPLLENMNAFDDVAKFSVINGDFIIDNCPKVGTGAQTAYLDRSFSKITEVRGHFKMIKIISAMNKPEKLLPRLKKVEGDFVVDGCTRLYYFTNSTNTANMPLEYIGGNLILQNNSVLQRLNGFENLKHLGGNVTILDNATIPVGQTDDEVIGYCKIKYYELAGILNKDAQVKLGTTSTLVNFATMTPCPYELIENVNGTYTAIPANKFLSSIGVNASINSRGENVNTTKEIMQYLGARWIRTSMGGSVNGASVLNETSNTGAGNSIGTYKKLYNEAGIKFSAGLGAGALETNIPVLISNVKRVIAATSPNAIIAIEGNNEPNNGNWYVKYNGEIGGGNQEGKTNWKPVARMQRDLYRAVKSDPVLGTAGSNYPVWQLTYGGASGENVGVQYLKVPEDDLNVPEEFRGVTYADAANLHNYFVHPSFSAPQNNQTWRAAAPGFTIPGGVDVMYRHYAVTWLNKYIGYKTDAELRALPKVTTETGATIGTTVSEEMQGLMYMSLFLAQFTQGFDYTSMYLLTDRRDESGNQSFGFYDKYYTPRLSAHYMHNMTTILKDNQNIAVPGKLTYSITGKTINNHELLLQKNDGTFELVIWGEKYKGGSNRIKVDFDQTYDEIWIYNPVKGITPESILKNVSSLELDVSNHPYIIEIGNHPDFTGIENTKEHAIEIKSYPNPVIQNLNIYANTEMHKIMLFDILGKCIYKHEGSTSEKSIDMSNMPDGVYLMNVYDVKNICIKKERILKLKY